MKLAPKLWVAALAFALPSSILAQDQAETDVSEDQAAAVDTEATDPDLDTIVCKSERATGSRLKAAKRCQTKRQWAEEKAANRETLEKAQAGRWKQGN